MIAAYCSGAPRLPVDFEALFLGRVIAIAQTCLPDLLAALKGATIKQKRGQPI